jgi:hypothetical protein
LLGWHILDIDLDISWRWIVSKSSQQRAIANFRSRLAEKGLVRFEVTGRNSDRDLVRAVARRLAEGGPDAERLRAAVNQTIGGDPPKKGGILRALMASPLVGSELDLARPREEGRKVHI